jgi:hypothetical protein
LELDSLDRHQASRLWTPAHPKPALSQLATQLLPEE